MSCRLVFKLVATSLHNNDNTGRLLLLKEALYIDAHGFPLVPALRLYSLILARSEIIQKSRRNDVSGQAGIQMVYFTGLSSGNAPFSLPILQIFADPNESFVFSSFWNCSLYILKASFFRLRVSESSTSPAHPPSFFANALHLVECLPFKATYLPVFTN